MRNYTSILVMLIIAFLSNCNNYSENYKPDDLISAINYLEHTFSKKEKSYFKALQEQEAVLELHMSYGRWMRNNWIYGNKDSNLVVFFNELGIYNPDDMSSIILTSFHRKLNKKEIDLNAQVIFFKTYWSAKDDTKAREQALLKFNNFRIGDSVKILMKVDTTYGKRNAVEVSESENIWVFNPKIDLEIIGILNDKYIIGDSSNTFFRIKINQLKPKNTTVQMKKVNIGDTIVFSLIALKIFPVDKD